MNATAHDNLRESEERLRLAFWAANIGFWSWDLITNGVYLSPTWKSQLGYEDHELPNEFSTWENHLHPDDRESSWKVIHESQKDPQRIFEMYFRLKHKDQTYRWILSRGRVYRDASGKPVRIMGCHVDVTQQKEDERLLRESEARLRLVLEGGRMGMWVWDMQTNQTRWNQREYDLLDLPYEKGPYTSHDFFECLHPDDRQHVQDSIKRSLDQHTDFYDEFRVVLPNGKMRWLVGAGRTIRDSTTGGATQMMGVNYDVTPSKEALASLHEANEFNRQIIVNAQEGIIVYDRELKYRLWNPYMEKITGIPESAVLGKRTTELFPFMKKQGIEDYLQRALGGEFVQGSDMHYVSPILKNSGWTTGRYGPLRNAQGQIIGVIATVREITQRKLAETRLHEHQQRLQLILEQLPSILWTTDRNLMFTSSSGAGLKAMKMAPNEVVGKTLSEFIQSTDASHPTLKAHRQALSGQSITYDQEFLERDYHVHLEPLRDEAGAIQGCIGVALDVTERKRQEEEQHALEQRVQQAQKLESLEVLAGGIAHDFNNLLTGMLGYASLAQAELPANSPASRMVREIEKAAQRAADLSRQMLAYSGKGKFVIEVIQLDELVVEMAGLLKTIVTPKGQLHMATDPAVIEGDATQIRQVVMNLITNAADAIHHDGLIAIRTGVRMCTAQELANTRTQSMLPAGKYAFLEVQDNGMGMPPEVASKIFDPFFTTKFTGRGLGLASVLGIVRGHQGTIAVESAPGKGTTFRVLLPITVQPRQTAAATNLPAEPIPARGTILVIEDDPSVLGFVQFVMQKSGYEVLATTDSKQSLTLFEKNDAGVRAAIIDLTMPQMDGIELAQELRKRKPGLPILMMSGYSEELVTPRLDGMMINGFLKKPFRAADLTGMLASILENGK